MDLDAAGVHTEATMAHFERLRDGYAELQEKLSAVRATATSDDGFVTVTVGPGGQLLDLELNPRIYRRPDSRRLAETITQTVHRATLDASARIDELTGSLMPDEDLLSPPAGRLAGSRRPPGTESR